jgi:hypothetical protein
MDDSDMHWAAYDGDEEALYCYLRGGALHPDIPSDVDGGTCLMRAAEGGHLSCAQLCVEAGASVHAQDRFGRTALHYAWVSETGASGPPAVSDFLLGHGARGCSAHCERCRLKSKMLARRAARQQRAVACTLAPAPVDTPTPAGKKRTRRGGKGRNKRRGGAKAGTHNGGPSVGSGESTDTAPNSDVQNVVAGRQTATVPAPASEKCSTQGAWSPNVLKVFEEEFGDVSVANLIAELKQELNQQVKKVGCGGGAGAGSGAPTAGSAPVGAAVRGAAVGWHRPCKSSCGAGAGCGVGSGSAARRGLRVVPTNSLNIVLAAC